MLCCNFDHIDLSTAKTKLKFVIGYDLNAPDLKAMTVDIYDTVRHNMVQIEVGVDVCGTFSIISFVIDSFVGILILTLFVNTVLILFAEINVDLHRLSKFKCDYVNNNNIIIIMNTFSTFGGAAIVIGFFQAITHFVTQVIDKSLLSIMLSIESHAIIVGIAQVALYLGVQLSIDAIGCNSKGMHNVCDVFVIFFICNFLSLYTLYY